MHGANATTIGHFPQRGTFVANPRDGATNPGPPYRMSSTASAHPEPAPRLGEHRFDWSHERAPQGRRRGVGIASPSKGSGCST